MVLWAAVLEEWVATVWLVVMAAAWAAVVETVGGMSGALGVGAMMPTGLNMAWCPWAAKAALGREAVPHRQHSPEQVTGLANVGTSTLRVE